MTMEDDPSVSLWTILLNLGSALAEEQLWALAESAAEALHTRGNDLGLPSKDDIATFVLTPYSLHVLASGAINLTDDVAPADLRDKCLADEVKEDMALEADALKTHVYGLGATLFMAADYGLSDQEEPELSSDMEALISAMTDDEVVDRASVDEVLQDIRQMSTAHGRTATHILQQLYQLAQRASQVPGDASEIPAAMDPPPSSDTTGSGDIHASLMQEIRGNGSTRLRDAQQRILDGPDPYVTPREQLLEDIRRSSRATLQSLPSYEALPVPADATSDESAPTRRTVNGRAILPLRLSTESAEDDLSDLLGDWDPAAQVQLAFAAEAAVDDAARFLDDVQDEANSGNGSEEGRGRASKSGADSTPPSSMQQRAVLQVDEPEPLSEPQKPTFVGFGDFEHINKMLFKAELDELQDTDPKAYAAINANKLCAVCLKQRFTFFIRARFCEMCQRPVCGQCCSQVPLPQHIPISSPAMRRKLPV
ncbi:uncharacterized protein MONBRDRAFT_33154, partial [Monosiga brevicollis MX1]